MIAARSWFTPPIFTDEEQTRVAGLLHWILLTLMGANLFDMAILAVFAPETLPTFWINLVLLGVSLFCFGLQRRGKVVAASLLLCIITWGLLAGYCAISGGLASPAFGIFGMFIIFASILLGQRGAVISGAVCIFTAGILYGLGTTGQLTPLEQPPTTARLFATNTAIFVSFLFLMTISERSVLNSLTRARSGERELARRNEQLQQEIIRREQAQQEQARLAAILEATPDLVAMSDLQGNVIYLNRGGRNLYGVAADADVSTNHIQDYHPPETAQFILEQAIPTAVQTGTWSGETILRTRDGRDIPVSQVIIAHRGQDGSVEFLSTMIRDISDRKQTERQRLEIALQEERLSSFKEFLGNVSHDLRTPLTVVQTSLYLLERVDDPARRHEKVEVIEEQVELVTKYIQDLLDLTRLNQAPEFNFAPLDLCVQVEEIRATLAPSAEAKQIDLQMIAEIEPLPILADQQELNRAVTNLVENAIHYTPVGGRVELVVRQEGENVQLRVVDTGIGIDEADVTLIFERFYRSKTAKALRSGGTGLGLAIAKRIIEVHGGGIGVESTPGVGTTFIITLPLYQTTPSESTLRG